LAKRWRLPVTPFRWIAIARFLITHVQVVQYIR
jgi:hypothetical protein